MIPNLNPLLLTDVYNLSHQMLKENTDFEVSHIVNRQKGMIVFGFDSIAHEVLDYKIYPKDIEDATLHAKDMGMTFPKELWKQAISVCGGQYAKVKDFIKIEALSDGTWCPRNTPFAQISNIKKGFGELITWWEGVLLHAWFPSACATRAFEMRNYLTDNNYRLSKFHSFGFRGHQSMESAYWASRAWSLFLSGTDDFNVTESHLQASSIPALAHKVVQNWKVELDCYLEAVKRASEAGYKAISILIDTYSSKRFIEDYLAIVQDTARRYNIIPIYRPDSGNVLGQVIKMYNKLIAWKHEPGKDFAFIIGDSVNFAQAKECDNELKSQYNINPDILTWGIGAGFYKDLERDTLGWSMKTCFSNGRDTMKCTDVEWKKSIPGKVSLNYTRDGVLMAHTRTNDSCSTTAYHILNDQKPLSFGWIKMYANSPQNTNQKDIIFSDALVTKRTLLCES